MRSEDDMSADIYAQPDKAKTVYALQGEKVERMVDIYVSADSLRGLEPGSGMQEATQREPGDRDTVIYTKSSVRVAAVCLGLLCVLLIGFIIIAIHFYSGISSLTEEISQLKSNSNNMTKENELLKTKYSDVTKEKDKLQTINKDLTKNLNVMWERVNSTQWYKVASSWYYISNESKTWNQSRQDCLRRGADLVIVNSNEEKDFLSKQFNKKVWIGLTDVEVEGTWKWVDGTLLNTGFWMSQQPDNKGHAPNVEEDCAEIYRDNTGQALGWNDLSCGNTNYWICEIKI